MLEVHINPMLDFRDHLKHIIVDVRKLAEVVTKILLSPNRGKLVIDQLLKSKYHAIHLGICPDNQCLSSEKRFRSNPKLCNGGNTYNHDGNTNERSIPMKDRATQMGIEHITEILSKHTDRGYIAHTHTTRKANTYHH